MLISDQFTENEHEYVAGPRARTLYDTTVPAPVHTPARRPSTGEVPGLRAMADAHLAAGVRDSRRILSEALAAEQCRVPDRAYLTTCYLDAALDPTMTEELLQAEMLSVMIAGGAGPLTAEYAVEACVALMEGWCHRQRLGGSTC